MNIQRKSRYLFLNKYILVSFIFSFLLLTPKGVPHELHTNLPDNARSAIKLELPQTRHLLAVINSYINLGNDLRMIMVYSLYLSILKDLRK